ncbi:hypothetical protein DOK67_0001862 [Enterococcus sp. DIV0212c]
MIKYFRLLIAFVTVNSLIMIGIGLYYWDIELIKFTSSCFTLFFIGVIFSTFLHEYMHVLGARKAGAKCMEIQVTCFRFSLKIDSSQLSDNNQLWVAFLGPGSCLVVSFIFYSLSLFDNNVLLRSLSFLYGFHIINLLPIFGDGKVIFKVLIKKIKRK